MFQWPDYDSFHDTVAPLVPEYVFVRGLPVPRELVIAEAWADPFGAPGLILRAAYEMLGDPEAPVRTGKFAGALDSFIGQAPNKSVTLKGSTVMGQLVIANVYRVAIRMAAGGRDIINVVHVEGSASGQEAAAAAAVLAAWKVATGPLTQLSSLITMQDVTAMDLSSTNGGIAVVADSTAGSLTASNALATRGAAALIKLNGGTRSRSTRGRVYYGPIREANIQTDGASLESAAVTAFTTAFNAFKTSLSGDSFTLGVASRLTSTFTSASTLSVEATIATQRRRIRS